MSFKVSIIMLLLLLAAARVVDSGPAAYGICQAGCAAIVVACYAAGGAVFGTVTAGIGTPVAIIACNGAFGTCQAACIAALMTPTP